jgi:hypothetical protein
MRDTVKQRGCKILLQGQSGARIKNTGTMNTLQRGDELWVCHTKNAKTLSSVPFWMALYMFALHVTKPGSNIRLYKLNMSSALEMCFRGVERITNLLMTKNGYAEHA